MDLLVVFKFVGGCGILVFELILEIVWFTWFCGLFVLHGSVFGLTVCLVDVRLICCVLLTCYNYLVNVL